MDRFYTSPELADTLVGLTNKRGRKITVADFACGEGSLLLAAERRWPEASMIANDLSAQAIGCIRKNRPQWQLACADFLNPRSVRSSALRCHLGSVELILLNPPFSRIDKRTYKVYLGDDALQASIALAFVVNSVPFLRSRGVILAVLPDGCLIGKHDEPVWEALRKHFKVEIIRDNSRSAFRGVSARTCLVRMTKRDKKAADIPIVREVSDFRIARGRVQMHSREICSGAFGHTLVHTSHLVGGVITDSGEQVAGPVISGPALLFPRVGLVTPGKLCVLSANRCIVLSDCVLAVVLKSEQEAEALRKKVLAQWPVFASCYRGTGAPYITLERASAAFSKLVGADCTLQDGSDVELMA